MTLNIDNIKSFLSQFASQSESVYWLGNPTLTQLKYISPAFEKIWDRPRSILYKDPSRWITYIHPDDRHYNPICELRRRIVKEGSKSPLF